MTDELFAAEEPEDQPGPGAPLAERLRPRTLEEFVGQEHVVGAGRMLESALRGEGVQSLILWGPPGTGKTTLARLIAQKSERRFVPFSAVLAGIKEIRDVMSSAEAHRRRTGRGTLLFVDEIHRFNKAQQDAFLPFVERGDILLIGATTENPSFEVNGALLSRVRTVILEPLRPADLVRILRRGLEHPELGLRARVRASDAVLERMAQACDGDARRALTLLETAAGLVPDGFEIEPVTLQKALQRKVLHYDKSGEEHYNLISALHKSVRNGDDNAALYWLARMMHAGEDGNYLARRLIRMASEDVGLADPFALRVALDAAEAFERLGYPEGKIHLAQCAVYLARARKSNSIYMALKEAEADVERSAAEPVPLHLRNAPTRLMEEAGYGAGYRYVHDDPRAAQEMVCLPPGLAGKRYFKPREPGDSKPR